MDVTLYCYRKGRETLRKETAKLERQKAKISEELFGMTDENSTVRRRANKRMRLSQIGEDLRRKYEYIEEIDRLIDAKSPPSAGN
ncbi:hypothetical protein [Salibacterium lacus]|uniref:Uncharacterized protein n=1 Tax=Salibacterium lacus TaxID=1898109 RepID=A0ABW5SZP2_9BACI